MQMTKEVLCTNDEKISVQMTKENSVQMTKGNITIQIKKRKISVKSDKTESLSANDKKRNILNEDRKHLSVNDKRKYILANDKTEHRGNDKREYLFANDIRVISVQNKKEEISPCKRQKGISIYLCPLRRLNFDRGNFQCKYSSSSSLLHFSLHIM